jgi:hypothetical protein
MDPARKQVLLDLLAEQIAEGRARIAEREAELQADPGKLVARQIAEEQEVMRRDAIGGSPVSKTGPADIIYRRYDNEPLDAAPNEGGDGWERWERWFADRFAGHHEPERKAIIEATADFVNEMFRRERTTVDRRIATLEGELREVKGILATTLRQLDQTAAADIVDLSIRRGTDAA